MNFFNKIHFFQWIKTGFCFSLLLLGGCNSPETQSNLQSGKVQINIKTTVGTKEETGSVLNTFVFLTIREQAGEKILSNFKVQLLREGSWFSSIPLSLPAGQYKIEPVVFWDEAQSLLLEFSTPPQFIVVPNQLITINAERASVIQPSLADSLEKILSENQDGASLQLSVKALNYHADSLFFVDGTLFKSIDGIPVSLTYLTREPQKIFFQRDSKHKTMAFTIRSPDYKDTSLVFNIANQKNPQNYSIDVQIKPIHPIKKQLVAWYPFDGNAKDLSGNNCHGKEKQVLYTKDRFGRDKMAAKFKKDSQILLGDVFNDVYFPFTITVWLKTDYFDSRKNDFLMVFEIFNIDYDPLPLVYSGLGIHYLNGFVRTGFGSGAGLGYQYRKLVKADFFVGDGKWHFVAGVVKSPKDMNIFINNKSGYCNYISERYNGKASRLEHSTYPAVIGSRGEGILDDLRLYNYALTEAQIDSLYHEGGWK